MKKPSKSQGDRNSTIGLNKSAKTEKLTAKKGFKHMKEKLCVKIVILPIVKKEKTHHINWGVLYAL